MVLTEVEKTKLGGKNNQPKICPQPKKEKRKWQSTDPLESRTQKWENMTYKNNAYFVGVLIKMFNTRHV